MSEFSRMWKLASEAMNPFTRDLTIGGPTDKVYLSKIMTSYRLHLPAMKTMLFILNETYIYSQMNCKSVSKVSTLMMIQTLEIQREQKLQIRP